MSLVVTQAFFAIGRSISFFFSVFIFGLVWIPLCVCVFVPIEKLLAIKEWRLMKHNVAYILYTGDVYVKYNRKKSVIYANSVERGE